MDRVASLRRTTTKTPAKRGLADFFPRWAKASWPRGASTPPVRTATPHNAFQSLQQQEPETTAAFRAVDATMADEGTKSNKHKRSKEKKESKKPRNKKHHRQETNKEHTLHDRRLHLHLKDSEETEARKHESAVDSEKRPEVAGTAVAPPAKQPRLRLAQHVPATPRDEQPARRTPGNESDKSPLQTLLCYLLNDLRKMDPHEFFAWPVSDVISPGYSELIHSPMDFSTMRKRIDGNHYTCVSEFREDLKLMCNNAMAYYQCDTVYFNSAKHMWNYGNKLLSKDQLMALKSSLPSFEQLTSKELGFDVKPPPAVTKYPMLLKAPPLESLVFARKSRREYSQVAPDRLTAERANSKFGFLRQTEDGSTSLSILTPHGVGVKGPEEIGANLETLVGKLARGTGTLMNFKGGIKDAARPVNYLDHGPYSTYAPHYDSTFANLSKEESDLAYSTCEDELGVQCAETLPGFAKERDNITDMVCSLLDGSTSGGQHPKAVEAFCTHREDMVLQKKNPGPSSNPDAQARNVAQLNAKRNDSKPSGSSSAFNGLATDSAVAGSKHAHQLIARKDCTEVREDHIDYYEHHATVSSPLDSTSSGTSAVLQQKLQESSEVIDSLSRLQQERLSKAPPAHLSRIPGPSEQELKLAEKVAKTLSELVSFATPGSIVSVEAIRKAMGINYSPNV